MDSITVAWNKQAAGEVKILPNRQHFQSNARSEKGSTKRVHFTAYSPSSDQQAFESSAQPHSESIRSDQFIFTDHDYVPLSSTNAWTTASSEPLCSVRGLTITLVIIALIITGVTIALGVPLGTIRSSSNTGGIATQTVTVSNSLSTAGPLSLTSSVSVGSQSGAPCSSYTTIDDPTRNVAHVGTSAACDDGPIFNSSSGGAWIRFVGSSGTIMAQSPPGRNRCGGYIAMWLNGTLPTVVGATINGTLCFDSNPSICYVSLKTPVTYCLGSFYIYFLEPLPTCNARYCTTSAAPIG